MGTFECGEISCFLSELLISSLKKQFSPGQKITTGQLCGAVPRTAELCGIPLKVKGKKKVKGFSPSSPLSVKRYFAGLGWRVFFYFHLKVVDSGKYQIPNKLASDNCLN